MFVFLFLFSVCLQLSLVSLSLTLFPKMPAHNKAQITTLVAAVLLLANVLNNDEMLSIMHQ